MFLLFYQISSPFSPQEEGLGMRAYGDQFSDLCIVVGEWHSTNSLSLWEGDNLLDSPGALRTFEVLFAP
jgi:hypothetical protein